MNESIVRSLVVCVALVCAPLLLPACGVDTDSAESDDVGTVHLNLTGVGPTGTSYRLSTGTFQIQGPKNVNLSTDTDPNAGSIEAELPAGNYIIRLKTGWTFERFNGATYETVRAVLTSPNPAAFSVSDQGVTTVAFQFRAGDDVVELGNGKVRVVIGVDETGSCAPPLLACGAQCVDVHSDPGNCGACGLSCGALEVCTGGGCVSACPPSAADCDGDPATGCEASLDSDPQNCGACGLGCAPGDTCEMGVCLPPPCPAPRVLCAGSCIDMRVDLQNCGACGNVCPGGPGGGAGQCQNGVCGLLCQATTANCDGNLTNGCEVNFDANPACNSGLPIVGALMGDIGGDGIARQGMGESQFRFRINEGDQGVSARALSVRFSLITPTPGIIYTLEANCDGCGVNLSGSVLTLVWDEETALFGLPSGSDSGRDVFVQVRYLGGNACGGWFLQAQGNVAAGAPRTCSSR